MSDEVFVATTNRPIRVGVKEGDGRVGLFPTRDKLTIEFVSDLERR